MNKIAAILQSLGFRYGLMILIFFSSCVEEKNPCKLSEPILQDLASLDSLIKIPKIRERDSAWNFNNYKELPVNSATHETYRFIYVSSFSGGKVYRIEKINDMYKAVVKTIANDTLQIIKEFIISKKNWDNITNSLSINGFWTYQTSIKRSGLDGETWILEGYKPIKDNCTNKNYHYVYRWSPIDKKFIALCNLFEKLDQQ
jgi:hypothetical protein